jgi:putative transposase
VLKVSRSGYYEWLGRPLSARDLDNAYLANTVVDIHTASRGSYGAPRMLAELRLGRGMRVSRKRVAGLLRLAGQGRDRRQHPPQAPQAADAGAAR